MYWKMSIDLKRALVTSMGQHDPLDGYITNLQLRATAAALAQPAAGPDLEDETRGYASMIRRGDWATADPLGIGGLLIDACRVRQLVQQGVAADPALGERLLEASLDGLHAYAQHAELRLPAKYRLAFRELGLAIGLHAVEDMLETDDRRTPRGFAKTPPRDPLRALMQYRPMREEIENFWRRAEHQASATWLEHQDINEVMLATSLVPDGFLVLLAPE
jgi:hypothetical protein